MCKHVVGRQVTAWITILTIQIIMDTARSTTTSSTPPTTPADTTRGQGNEGYKKSAGQPTKDTKTSATRENMIVGLSIGFGSFGGLLVLCCVCKCICSSNNTKNRINPGDISKRLGLPE
ncbi:uncharacterized protein LOC135484984 isoform X2 [Lineus longissimus]|uniref:uncharacterized protein LOC135484984 isoform X2 n=1 Tax=Lineus longissimus TaxID=88925 RepID=UPI00315CB072